MSSRARPTLKTPSGKTSPAKPTKVAAETKGKHPIENDVTETIIADNNEKRVQEDTKQSPQEPADASKYTFVDVTTTKIKYTEEEVSKQLSGGYLKVMSQLWDHIPNGSHLRFFKKGSEPRYMRYRPGGFLRSHFMDGDKKMLMLENRSYGQRGDGGYFTHPVAYDEIEEIWKKYDKYAFIEIHLIYGSLAQKKREIEDLNERIARLEARAGATATGGAANSEVNDLKNRMTQMENILIAAVKR